ncbi:MAG: right-handed parallel beta-helix repeat-containing protein [Armatimonadetes bacterium]|nr:right-handed parallel beta-helix repeat-containing protein [Armatimonadota bacterium]
MHSTRISLSLALALLAAVASPAPEVIPIPNGDFEAGAKGWQIQEFDGVKTVVSDEQAASGKYSLKVVDSHDKNGSHAVATKVAIPGAGVYELRGKLFPVSGSGLGMYVRVQGKDGALVAPGDTFQMGLGGSGKQWVDFTLPIYVGDEAAFLELWVHSYSHAIVEAYLDDLHFVSLGADALKPPWEPQYKIRPEETGRLTAADVVGPDGIVYPNWTKCGVQGGIPQVRAFANLADFGGVANDDEDDAAALDRACVACGKAGGGAVVLGEGIYYMDRPVTIRDSGVVIRGQGAGKTRIIFRYALPESGVAIYAPQDGAKVGRNTQLEMHAVPAKLMKMRLMVDDVVIKSWERSAHSGNTFAMTAWGSQVVGKVPDGKHTLRGVAEYQDGSERTGQITIDVDSAYTEKNLVPWSQAAITFSGQGLVGPKRLLAQDGKRGATQIELQDAGDLKAGDRILIDGPATERWKELTRNKCPWGTYRRYMVEITGVDGNKVSLAQPLRIEFPVIDGSYVQKLVATENCGLEGLSIEQTEDLWITTAQFNWAWNCWARGVTVRKCGRNPVYGGNAKFCEIRDCVFDDAWYKGGGGTAYTGWENCFDCLMEDCETFKFRHAPLYQWAASGCVIRNSVFHDSDGQWHSGWTNENLFENCIIESTYGNGGYGFGMWASPPEDTAHGPNGPRNVVYNCDVTSPKDGLWMGGMNENWLILYNRFTVAAGRGVFMKTASFDHIIKGNVFVLKDSTSPMVMLATPDCSGVEIIGNRVYGGSGKFAAGLGKPLVTEGNQALELQDAARPVPPVPSIYEWQQQNVR